MTSTNFTIVDMDGRFPISKRGPLDATSASASRLLDHTRVGPHLAIIAKIRRRWAFYPRSQIPTHNFKHQGKKMKLLVRLALLCSMASAQFAWADAGPYYVSYPGFCDVKKVYVNARNDVYGTETSCTKSLGTPLLGSILADGKVIVGTTVTGTLCLFTHFPSKTLTIGCSAGADIAYEDHANGYVVRQSMSEKSGEPARSIYNISTEMPDIEKIKDLPSLGF